MLSGRRKKKSERLSGKERTKKLVQKQGAWGIGQGAWGKGRGARGIWNGEQDFGSVSHRKKPDASRQLPAVLASRQLPAARSQ